MSRIVRIEINVIARIVRKDGYETKDYGYRQIIQEDSLYDMGIPMVESNMKKASYMVMDAIEPIIRKEINGESL